MVRVLSDFSETRISTGVKELDAVLGGGFRKKSVILISGNPGAGKTILSTQFLVEGCKNGEKAIYVSFAENREDYFFNMDILKLGVRDFAEKGLFKFLEFPTMDLEGMREASEMITEEISEYEPHRLVIDSISVFTQSMGISETRQFLHVLFGRILKDMNVTTILVGEIPLGEERTGFGVEEFVADGVILLKYSRFGKAEKREMDIVKMRGIELLRSHYEYTINKRYNGIGLIVLPTQVNIRNISTEKISTGIEGLDKMLYGGVYRGSLTLIQGATGIGKTTISLHFLYEHAKRGETTLFMSFEEPVGQIIRVMNGFQWEHEKLDNFLIESYIPEAFTPLHYYNLIREIVEERNPSLFVIDSITAIQHTLKEEDFVEFIRYLQLLCKERGLTAYITALTRGYSLGMSGISTLADNIYVLRYMENGDKFIREIYVMKTRGSPHDKEIKRFEITDSGLVIED